MSSAETKENSACTFLWRIENFSYWDSECHGEKIVSPHFSSAFLYRCQRYSLYLFPKGTEERDQHLRVQIYPVDSIRSRIAACELSFLDGNGSALTAGIIRNPKIKKDTPLELPDCPTQEEVFQSKRSSFLPHDTLTVRCRLWISDLIAAVHRHSTACSRIDVRELSILFPHRDLRTLGLDEEKRYQVFIGGVSSVKKKFGCTYSLTGSSLSNTVVNFKISRADNEEPLLLTCQLSILNTDRKTIKCIQDRHKFNRTTGPQNWHFTHFLSRQELLNDRDIYSISINIIASMNSISNIIESEIWENQSIEYDSSTTSDGRIQITQKNGDQPNNSQQNSDSLTILREDFLSIYKDQTLFDFELRSGDVSFPVHKNVLSARSPVFRAMFCGDMREVHSTSVDVPDVDAHTLNRMLTFLYSGSVGDLKWEGAAKLYYAADKYQVLSLIKDCSSVMRSSISVSNVCDILALADRHQDDDLISFVHDFILSNYDEVLLSEEWDKLLESDPHFAGKTMKKIYKKKVQLKAYETGSIINCHIQN